jgi:hypothetical protein
MLQRIFYGIPVASTPIHAGGQCDEVTTVCQNNGLIKCDGSLRQQKIGSNRNRDSGSAARVNSC